jgi:hypothetical protein
MTTATYEENKCCPLLWRELHLHALKNDNTTEADEREFFKQWMHKIPKIGCPCKTHWVAWYYTQNTDYRNFFAWSVTAHNAVNERLGKRLWSVEEARTHWQNELK